MSLRTAVSGLFHKPYSSVSAAEAGELVKGGAVLLDVRDQQEWVAGHAPKARHIPLAELPRRQRELAARQIITVCRSGGRSARAATLLAAEGRDVVNLKGGMRAWSAAGLPLVGKGGRQGTVA